jgi:hypothetical protein
MTCLQQHRTRVRAGAPVCAGVAPLAVNTIGGALTCTRDVPAPTNADVSNAVGDGRSGQTCALLGF